MNEGFNNNYEVSPNGDNGGKGMAIASMVLGIISIVVCCRWYIGLPAGIVGVILGILYNKKNGSCGMSTAGIVCSIIGIVLVVATFILAAVGIAMLGGLAEGLESYGM